MAKAKKSQPLTGEEKNIASTNKGTRAQVEPTAAKETAAQPEAAAKASTGAGRARKAPARSPANKKSSTAKAKSAAPAPQAPLIDTNLAASVAAKMLVHKDLLTNAAQSSDAAESDAFKQLKEGVHKPIGNTTPTFLQSLTPDKKFNAIPNRHQQIGRNQTFGADVNRTGVPRRTGG